MRAILVLILALCLAIPAQAQQAGPDDMNLCLCSSALSRLLCKKKNELAFVAKIGDGVYLYTVHYGARDTRFTCRVTADAILVNGETTPAILRTIPYVYDPAKMSGVFRLTEPDCAIGGQARCVGKKTAKQLTVEKENAFWDRPIPTILQDELRAGTFGNATSAEPAPATPSGSTPSAQ